MNEEQLTESGSEPRPEVSAIEVVDPENPGHIQRLIHMADRRIRQKYWLGRPGARPAHLDAEDVVASAFLRAGKADRHDFKFLAGAIRSIVSNEARRPENETLRPVEPDSNDAEPRDVRPDPEQLALASEEEDRAQQFLLEFAEFIKGDAELEKIFDCFLEGYEKPREIAKETGIAVKVVYNANKRFDRKMKEFRAIKEQE